MIEVVPFFKGLTETEKTTISNRSRKLFTLSSIHQGTESLLNRHSQRKALRISPTEEQIAIEFWTEVGKHIKEWNLAVAGKVTAAELRHDFIHAHGLALHALGIMGNVLISTEPKKWKERLRGLENLDWSRSNTRTWEGRAMIGGHVSKAHGNVVLTSAVLKRAIGLQLSPEEQRLENSLRKRSD